MMEPTLEETTQESGFRFSTRTLLWAITLLGVGIGTFGPWLGLYITFLVLTCNETIHRVRKGFKYVLEPIVLLIMIHLPLALVLPAYSPILSGNHVGQSKRQMMQLALSIQTYQMEHGHAPRPYTTDTEGSRLHSWRTTLLNYLEEPELHRKIDFDKRWNDKENKRLCDSHRHHFFRSPRLPTRTEGENASNYLAIIDEESFWNPNGTSTNDGGIDDPSDTIILIETFGKEIPWYEPRDLTLEEAVDVLVGDVGVQWTGPGLFVSERLLGDGVYGRVCGFADGHVECVFGVADRKTARALLTRSGGEKLPDDWGREFSNREEVVLGHVIHWGRIACTLLFIFLAVLPLWKQKARRADSV